MPGRTPRPRSESSDEPDTACDAYLWGADLYNHGYFWEAHEAWEALWRCTQHDAVRRAFVQGLIQCSAACLKLRLGDVEACRRLAQRGLARLHAVPAAHGYMGLPVARFAADFQVFVASQPLDLAHRPRLEIERTDTGEADGSRQLLAAASSSRT